MLTKARVTAMAYHKPPLIDTPKRPRPQGRQDNEHNSWCPYPSQRDGLPAHFLCYFNSLCDLSILVSDWCQSVFGDPEKPHFDAIKAIVESIHQRLLDWEQGIPSCIKVVPGSCVLPQVLCLQYVSNKLDNEPWTDDNTKVCTTTPLPSWSSDSQKI